MVVVNDGRDEIRNKLKEIISQMKVGTDGTTPSKTDTALGNAVYTDSTSESDGGIGVAEFSIRLGSGDGNGNTLKEVGTFDSTGTLITRSTHAGIDKDSGFELLTEAKLEVKE